MKTKITWGFTVEVDCEKGFEQSLSVFQRKALEEMLKSQRHSFIAIDAAGDCMAAVGLIAQAARFCDYYIIGLAEGECAGKHELRGLVNTVGRRFAHKRFYFTLPYLHAVDLTPADLPVNCMLYEHPQNALKLS